MSAKSVGLQGGAPLRLRLQFIRAEESGDPFAFQFVPQSYILPTLDGGSPSARLDWNAQLLADLAAVRLPGRDPAVVQKIGEALSRFVKDASWARQQLEIEQALTEGRPIFLSIRSSAAEIYALPWELLTRRNGQFIGATEQLLVRYEWPESPSTPEASRPAAQPGRILFAWSAAGGAVPASEQLRAITDACQAGFLPFDNRQDVIGNATLGQIVSRLEEAQRAAQPISVLHLLCHGGKVGSSFGLVLDGKDGPAMQSAIDLRQQLAPFAAMVRLVVLSACDSGNMGESGNQLGSIAQTLHRAGFQAVIASRYPLSVDGSIRLSRSLYAELLTTPASLEAAFLAARRRLCLDEVDQSLSQRQLDWASLQLYARHEDGDDSRPLAFRPFRGLLTFEPEHRRFFFGRDKEVREVVTDLQTLVEAGSNEGRKKERLLIVAGASGTGKSSLVLAGVVPRLCEEIPGLRFLRMRPGPSPLKALADALAQLPPNVPGLLVVDQFEELFTLTADVKVRASFARELWRLASAAQPDLRILITLRVDFIGRCGELVLNDEGLRLDQVAYDEAHRVFVAQMLPDQLLTSILEPVRKVGLEFDEGLAQRMLEEVQGEPGALPMLQDALDVLWQHRAGRRLMQSAYEQLGGVVGALQKRADATVDKLVQADAAYLPLTQRLLTSLVAVNEDTAMDTRQRIAQTELRQAFTESEGAGLELILQEFLDARLLVLDGDGQAQKVEVAHEALIRKWPRLRAWLDENRAALLTQRRLNLAARQWEAAQRDESLLYRGTQLAQAIDWRKVWDQRSSKLLREFLDASQQAEDERQSQIKHKALELRERLLVAVALSISEDPTAMASVLREGGRIASRLWTQTAVDTLGVEIAEVVLRGDDTMAGAVACSPDGTRICVGYSDGTARIWNADGSGAPIILSGHTGLISAICFSPDGQQIATASYDKTARIWNADGSGESLLLEGHDGRINTVAFSPDGQFVATGADGQCGLWSSDASSSEQLVKCPGGDVYGIAFVAAGEAIIAGCSDGSVQLWRLDEGAGPSSVLELGEPILALAASPDGQAVVVGLTDRTARILMPGQENGQIELSGHRGPVLSVAYSADGQWIVTGSVDGSALIWSTDGKCVHSLPGHPADVHTVAFSPDDKKIITCAGDGAARIWNVDAASATKAMRVLFAHDGMISDLALSPNGKQLVTGSADHTARISNADGSGTPKVLKGHKGTIHAVAYSPDGKQIVTASADKELRVWNVEDPRTPKVLKGHSDEVCAVAYSPDGKKIISGSVDETVRIWNADGSGKPVVLKGHEGAVTALAYSPDGRTIATASVDSMLRVWKADGTATPQFMQAGAIIWALAYSPDGTKIAVGCEDRKALIWNVDGASSPISLKGHVARVNAVTWSSDGQKLATASDDGTVRVWNADGSGSPLVLKGHRSGVCAVAFSKDSQRLWSAGGNRNDSNDSDNGVRVYLIGTQVLREELWQRTNECLSLARRCELLLESPEEARLADAQCRQELEARRRSRQTK